MFTDFVIYPIIRSQIGEYYFWLSIIIIVINVMLTILVLLKLPYLFIYAKYKRWREIKERFEARKK